MRTSSDMVLSDHTHHVRRRSSLYQPKRAQSLMTLEVLMHPRR